MQWFDFSFAVRGFVIMTALGLSQAFREPVFDPGMIQAAPIAGLIMGVAAGFAAPPLRWLKARFQARRRGERFCDVAEEARERQLIQSFGVHRALFPFQVRTAIRRTGAPGASPGLSLRSVGTFGLVRRASIIDFVEVLAREDVSDTT